MAVLYLLVARSQARRRSTPSGAGASRRAVGHERARDQRMLVTGGRLLDPRRAATVAAEDLLLEDGRIAARGPAGTRPAEAHVIDARGLLVVPGFVDMHVHLREPGQEYKETSPRVAARRWRAASRRSPAWRTPPGERQRRR